MCFFWINGILFIWCLWLDRCWYNVSFVYWCWRLWFLVCWWLVLWCFLFSDWVIELCMFWVVCFLGIVNVFVLEWVVVLWWVFLCFVFGVDSFRVVCVCGCCCVVWCVVLVFWFDWIWNGLSVFIKMVCYRGYWWNFGFGWLVVGDFWLVLVIGIVGMCWLVILIGSWFWIGFWDRLCCGRNWIWCYKGWCSVDVVVVVLLFIGNWLWNGYCWLFWYCYCINFVWWFIWLDCICWFVWYMICGCIVFGFVLCCVVRWWYGYSCCWLVCWLFLFWLNVLVMVGWVVVFWYRVWLRVWLVLCCLCFWVGRCL